MSPVQKYIQNFITGIKCQVLNLLNKEVFNNIALNEFIQTIDAEKTFKSLLIRKILNLMKKKSLQGNNDSFKVKKIPIDRTN